MSFFSTSPAGSPRVDLSSDVGAIADVIMAPEGESTVITLSVPTGRPNILQITATRGQVRDLVRLLSEALESPGTIQRSTRLDG